jgi:hypothetical protein
MPVGGGRWRTGGRRHTTAACPWQAVLGRDRGQRHPLRRGLRLGDLIAEWVVWMAIMQLVLFTSSHLATNQAAFWFLMQVSMIIGFVTTYPVNW